MDPATVCIDKAVFFSRPAKIGMSDGIPGPLRSCGRHLRKLHPYASPESANLLATASGYIGELARARVGRQHK